VKVSLYSFGTTVSIKFSVLVKLALMRARSPNMCGVESVVALVLEWGR